MYYILLNPLAMASANTSDGSTLRWVEWTHITHADGGENGCLRWM